MADDMNTAAALGHVFGLMKIVNRILDDKTLKKSADGRDPDPPRPETLRALGRGAGPLPDGQRGVPDPAQGQPGQAPQDRHGPDRRPQAGPARQEARAAKDFARSDAIDELLALGVTIQDTAQGPQWDVE